MTGKISIDTLFIPKKSDSGKKLINTNYPNLSEESDSYKNNEEGETGLEKKQRTQGKNKEPKLTKNRIKKEKKAKQESRGERTAKKRDTGGIPRGCRRDTKRIPKGYQRDTEGIKKGIPKGYRKQGLSVPHIDTTRPVHHGPYL